MKTSAKLMFLSITLAFGIIDARVVPSLDQEIVKPVEQPIDEDQLLCLQNKDLPADSNYVVDVADGESVALLLFDKKTQDIVLEYSDSNHVAGSIIFVPTGGGFDPSCNLKWTQEFDSNQQLLGMKVEMAVSSTNENIQCPQNWKLLIGYYPVNNCTP